MLPESIAKPRLASRVSARLDVANQAIPFAVWTRLRFGTLFYDGLNEFNVTAPNYSFTPRRAGYYLLTFCCVIATAVPAVNYVEIGIYSALGALLSFYRGFGTGTVNLTLHTSVMEYLTPTDTRYCAVYVNNPLGETVTGTPTYTRFLIHRLS